MKVQQSLLAMGKYSLRILVVQQMKTMPWACCDEHKNLLLKESWHKLSEPVFVSSEKNKQFGPGHNSFTVSEDGCFDILIYHARPEKNQKGIR